MKCPTARTSLSAIGHSYICTNELRWLSSATQWNRWEEDDPRQPLADALRYGAVLLVAPARGSMYKCHVGSTPPSGAWENTLCTAQPVVLLQPPIRLGVSAWRQGGQACVPGGTLVLHRLRIAFTLVVHRLRVAFLPHRRTVGPPSNANYESWSRLHHSI